MALTCKVIAGLRFSLASPSLLFMYQFWGGLNFGLILWLCVAVCPLSQHILHSWPGPLSLSSAQLSLLSYIYLVSPVLPSVIFLVP